MAGFFARFRQAITLYTLLLLSLILMQGHAEKEKGLQGASDSLFEAVAWMETSLSSVLSGVTHIYRGYVHLVDTERENSILREQVADLENRLNHLYEIELENQRLRKLLSFKKTVPYRLLPARIVGKNFTGWSRTLMINQGRREGIRVGMAVVRPEGVVGRILSVSKTHAQVQLIIDRNSDIPALFQSTRAEGIAEGGVANQCRVKYLTRLPDIEPGERVVTSGLGRVFPKGLIIGSVSSVRKKPYGLFQEAAIIPAVDFSRIEEVFVVRSPVSETHVHQGTSG